MPNAKVLAKKQSDAEVLKEKFGKSKLVILADYRGINVEDITDILRSKQRERVGITAPPKGLFLEKVTASYPMGRSVSISGSQISVSIPLTMPKKFLLRCLKSPSKPKPIEGSCCTSLA